MRKVNASGTCWDKYAGMQGNTNEMSAVEWIAFYENEVSDRGDFKNISSEESYEFSHSSDYLDNDINEEQFNRLVAKLNKYLESGDNNNSSGGSGGNGGGGNGGGNGGGGAPSKLGGSMAKYWDRADRDNDDTGNKDRLEGSEARTFASSVKGDSRYKKLSNREKEDVNKLLKGSISVDNALKIRSIFD